MLFRSASSAALLSALSPARYSLGVLGLEAGVRLVARARPGDLRFISPQIAVGFVARQGFSKAAASAQIPTDRLFPANGGVASDFPTPPQIERASHYPHQDAA